MNMAIKLASNGIGLTSPNPCVGAVIVHENQVIGSGFHKKAGLPHAEREAIADGVANGNAPLFADSTLYVTLEPCSTSGKTPPCTDAILKHRFKRVVYGSEDPNPKHRGAAADILEQAGIKVTRGVLEKECDHLIRGFRVNMLEGRPWVIAKSAMSLDGRISRSPERSQWLTNEKSRSFVHTLRAECDAILTGGNTMRLDNPSLTITPRTYLFGGKAAASYGEAKETIRLINVVAHMVNSDRKVNKQMKVLFLENYNVSLGQLLFPAADVSEQISTAGKEASGTGNMKFMMNGAITLGTLDGANVEIRDAVGGDENCVIFGLKAEEVLNYYATGTYSAWDEYNTNENVRLVVDQLTDGTYGNFQSLSDYLIRANDEFFILKDFNAYADAHVEIMKRYQKRFQWLKASAVNIANSGVFSSDRTIDEYANEIWQVKPVMIP